MIYRLLLLHQGEHLLKTLHVLLLLLCLLKHDLHHTPGCFLTDLTFYSQLSLIAFVAVIFDFHFCSISFFICKYATVSPLLLWLFKLYAPFSFSSFCFRFWLATRLSRALFCMSTAFTLPEVFLSFSMASSAAVFFSAISSMALILLDLNLF